MVIEDIVKLINQLPDKFNALKKKVASVRKPNRNYLIKVLAPYVLPTVENHKLMCKIISMVHNWSKDEACRRLSSQLFFDPKCYSLSAMKEYKKDLTLASNLGYNEFKNIDIVKTSTPIIQSEYLYTIKYTKGDKTIYRTDILDRVYKIKTGKVNSNDWSFDDNVTVPVNNYDRGKNEPYVACLLINDPNFVNKFQNLKLTKLDELLRKGEKSTIEEKRKLLIYDKIPVNLKRCGILMGDITKKKYKNTNKYITRWKTVPNYYRLKDFPSLYKYFSTEAESGLVIISDNS